MSFCTALPPNCEFVVNFAPELAEIITEAKYLEKLGFQVPDLARSVALQEDKFIAFQDGLKHCLYRYHHALASLSDAEVRTNVDKKLCALKCGSFVVMPCFLEQIQCI